MNIQRIHSLDYLRGIMACGVMIYHFSSWTFGEFDASTILGRLGIYGVSFFYILSGLTLFIVYADSPTSLRSLFLFGAKRFFRIYPLLWAVTIVYIVSARIFDVNLLLLNFTGLFGFVKPDAYIGTGVWSIGNELVFYALFPLLIFFRKKNMLLFYASLLVVVSVAIYFAFELLERDILLKDQWKIYINPFNQFYLFAGGMFIGSLTAQHNISMKPFVTYFFLFVLLVLFCIYPVYGDVTAIVTDWARVIFSLICFLICFVVHVSPLETHSTVHSIFSFLGATSYSIYLLHPVVYRVLERISSIVIKVDLVVILVASIPATLFISFLSYKYLEKPMIQFGSKMVNRFKRTEVIS